LSEAGRWNQSLGHLQVDREFAKLPLRGDRLNQPEDWIKPIFLPRGDLPHAVEEVAWIVLRLVLRPTYFNEPNLLG
jgi:hypothetical protein